MASLAETLRQAGYVTPQGVTGPNAPLARQLKNYVTNVIPTAAQNLAQQRADIDAGLTMGDQGIQVGDREAFERQMAQVPNLMGLTAYHGTPHTIKGKFDISKVGTGEGAQAYGHGMYFAENPAVAKQYQETLGQKKDIAVFRGKDGFYVKQGLGSEGQNLAGPFASGSEAEKVRKALPENQGNLYKVDIPDEYIPNMLDWDKPLKEQENVLKAIRSQIKDADLLKSFDYNVEHGMSGANAYKNWVNLNWAGKGQRGYKTDKDASEALNALGIKGIRYEDAGSRGKGGTSNFVVFDPAEVKILEQNSKPLTRKEILEQELKKVVE
jgi:hypothetical protein